MTTVTLITKAGCHLCEPARAVVAQVCQQAGVPWAERDLGSEADWPQRYGELIPVVLVGQKLHGYWRIDAARLREQLRQSVLVEPLEQ